MSEIEPMGCLKEIARIIIEGEGELDSVTAEKKSGDWHHVNFFIKSKALTKWIENRDNLEAKAKK